MTKKNLDGGEIPEGAHYEVTQPLTPEKQRHDVEFARMNERQFGWKVFLCNNPVTLGEAIIELRNKFFELHEFVSELSDDASYNRLIIRDMVGQMQQLRDAFDRQARATQQPAPKRRKRTPNGRRQHPRKR